VSRPLPAGALVPALQYLARELKSPELAALALVADGSGSTAVRYCRLADVCDRNERTIGRRLKRMSAALGESFDLVPGQGLLPSRVRVALREVDRLRLRQIATHDEGGRRRPGRRRRRGGGVDAKREQSFRRDASPPEAKLLGATPPIGVCRGAGPVDVRARTPDAARPGTPGDKAAGAAGLGVKDVGGAVVGPPVQRPTSGAGARPAGRSGGSAADGGRRRKPGPQRPAQEVDQQRRRRRPRVWRCWAGRPWKTRLVPARVDQVDVDHRREAEAQARALAGALTRDGWDGAGADPTAWVPVLLALAGRLGGWDAAMRVLRAARSSTPKAGWAGWDSKLARDPRYALRQSFLRGARDGLNVPRGQRVEDGPAWQPLTPAMAAAWERWQLGRDVEPAPDLPGGRVRLADVGNRLRPDRVDPERVVDRKARTAAGDDDQVEKRTAARRATPRPASSYVDERGRSWVWTSCSGYLPADQVAADGMPKVGW